MNRSRFIFVAVISLVFLYRCDATKTILGTIRSVPHLNTLAEHLDRFPEVTELLSSPHVSLTFFAPTNAAFAKSPLPKHPNAEKSVWFYMTLPEKLYEKQMHYGQTFESLLVLDSLGGKPQRVRVTDDGFGKLINRHARVLEGNPPLHSHQSHH